MKGKKLIALLMSTALCLSLLAGCGDSKDDKKETTPASASVESTVETTEESTEPASQPAQTDDPLEKITQGYYTYAYPVEGLGDFTYFFHFYEEAPVLGSVFYAGFALNQINFTGTYTVEEKDFEYACFPTREESLVEGAEAPKGTAPYTITFYDWSGNVIDSCGFDGDVLYNDMDVITAIGGSPAYYAHDTEGEASKYYEFYQGEVGMAYLDFVAESDPTSTLTLYHNGTYMDLVNMMVEGTWTMAETGDGYEYTLTPGADSDTPAVLTVAADTMTASYTPEGGETVAMMNASQAGPKVFLTMTGSIPIPGQDGVNADVNVLMYDDGTCGVAASAFGQEMELDQGTYSMGEDGFTITFQFDNAGEIVSSLDAESGQVSIQYVLAGTNLGDIDTVLNVVTE